MASTESARDLLDAPFFRRHVGKRVGSENPFVYGSWVRCRSGHNPRVKDPWLVRTGHGPGGGGVGSRSVWVGFHRGASEEEIEALDEEIQVVE